MAEEDILAGMILPDPGNPSASIDTGQVTSLIDATHVMVDLGDKTVTAFLPESVAGFIAVGSGVKISNQQNTYVIDSVLSGSAPQPPMTLAVPCGVVLPFLSTSAPNSHWLLCNGGSFSAGTYPDLNTFLGGTTLPDMRDRFLVGQSPKTIKTTGGSFSHTQTLAELANHGHQISVDNTTLLYPATGNVANIIYPVANGSVTTNVGGSSPMDITNKYYSVQFIIKADNL